MSESAGAPPAGVGTGELRVIPVPGLPDFRPGDDLAGALAAAAPWLVDGDVVVVTSKVVSGGGAVNLSASNGSGSAAAPSGTFRVTVEGHS